MSRAIIYARVSSEEQAKGFSLATQIAACESYAKERGLAVVAAITDNETGSNLDRPGFTQMQQLLASGVADTVIVYCVDRLHRRLAHALLTRDAFQRAQITIHYAQRGPAGQSADEQFAENIEALLAEFERAKIRERTMRGRQAKVERGLILGNGPAPYGYRYIGRGRERYLAIDEEEAAIVRLIFQWYAHGEDGTPLSTRLIAQRLKEMQVPTRADKTGRRKQRKFAEWDLGTIYSMFHNDVYRGIFYAYRYRKTPDGRDVRRPREEWIGLPVPALIEPELWEAVQRKAKEGSALSRRNGKHEYLLGRRIRCICGYSMTGRPYSNGSRLYQCYTRRHPGVRPCAIPSISAQRVDTAVWEWIATKLLDSEELAASLARRQDGIMAEQQPLLHRQSVLEQQHQEVDEQSKLLVDLYLLKRIDLPTFDSRKAALDARRTQILQELELVQAQMSDRGLSELELNTLTTFVDLVREGLDDADVATKRRIVDLLDVRVTVAVEDNERVLYVQCVFYPNVVRLVIASSASRS